MAPKSKMTITTTTANQPLPPGSFGLPLIGETIKFLTDGKFAQKRENKYGPIFKSHLFGRPTVFISGAKANQFLFANENKYFAATWPKSTKILLGPTSLAVQGGTFHTSRRKLLFQAFQPRALASYIPTMESITARYLKKWQHLETFTWYPELRAYTFEIASQLFVGRNRGYQKPLIELFTEWVDGLFSLPIALPVTKFGKAVNARQNLLKYLEKIIIDRQQKADPGNDALGILLTARDEQGNSLSLEELKDQILLLLFAGHETLTSAIASFCLLMPQHPEIWQRARQEQQQFSPGEPLTMETLKEMTYLEQVLKEVLRLIPPVGGGFREVIADCTLNGYFLPKGWFALYQIGTTHQDETVYPDRARFDPDRFSPENSVDKQKRFGYIPFGGGLRECLGKEFAKLEMKIFAALLLRGYQWELLPEQDLSVVAVPTPHPRSGLGVRFGKLS